MQEWEYDIWYLDPSRGTSSIRDELERRGREGWELVATPVAWDFDGAGDGRQLVGILKRSVGAELPVAARRELAPGDVIYDPGPRTEVAPLPALRDDACAVEVVDAMIRGVKADLVANRRERVVADDKHKKLRTTHLRVELHLLKQSRTWVRTSADVAWVQSGLEAWRSAYGLREPRRHEWLARLREMLPPGAPIGSDESGLVDVDELRDLLVQTRGYKIGLLLAQECAVALILRDPSRTDREVEATLARVAGRSVIDRADRGRPRADAGKRPPCASDLFVVGSRKLNLVEWLLGPGSRRPGPQATRRAAGATRVPAVPSSTRAAFRAETGGFVAVATERLLSQQPCGTEPARESRSIGTVRRASRLRPAWISSVPRR